MNLLSRYIEAVKRYLPVSSREDAGRELGSLLQEELEERAQKKGAPLDDDEIAEFLREHGHPYRVALRYFRRSNLISERAYPLYRRVLSIVLSLLLLADVVIALGRLGQDDGSSALHVVGLFLNDVLGTLLFGFALVTLIFHFRGERLADNGLFWRWNPRALPELGEKWADIRLRATFYDIVLAVLCIAVLTASYHAHNDSDAAVRVNATARAWVPWLTAFALVYLAVNLLNLFQRYWTRAKLGVLAAIDALAGLVLLRLVFVGDLLQVSIASTGTAHDALARQWMGWWPAWYVKLMLLAILARLAYLAYIYYRRATTGRVPTI